MEKEQFDKAIDERIKQTNEAYKGYDLYLVRGSELRNKKLFYVSIMIGLLAIAGVIYYLGTNDMLIKVNNYSTNNNTCINNPPNIPACNCDCPNIQEVKCNCFSNFTITPVNNINVNGS